MESRDAGLARPGIAIFVRCGMCTDGPCRLGTQVIEAQIRRLIGHSRLGVSLAVTQRKLSDIGAVVHRHEDWSLDDVRDALRAGYYPIVGVERHLLGYARAFHAVVLVEVTSTAIAALDSLDASATLL